MRDIVNAINTYRNFIHNSLPQETDKATAVALTVGLVIGSNTPLPTEAVQSPRDWYVSMALEGVQQKVNTVNDCYVIDCATVLRIAKDVWEMRYSMVHLPTTDSAINLLLGAVSQGPAEILPVHTALTKDNRYAVSNLVAALNECLCKCE